MARKITVSVSDDVYKKIEEKAKAYGLTVHQYVKRLLLSTIGETEVGGIKEKEIEKELVGKVDELSRKLTILETTYKNKLNYINAMLKIALALTLFNYESEELALKIIDETRHLMYRMGLDRDTLRLIESELIRIYRAIKR